MEENLGNYGRGGAVREVKAEIPINKAGCFPAFNQKTCAFFFNSHFHPLSPPQPDFLPCEYQPSQRSNSNLSLSLSLNISSVSRLKWRPRTRTRTAPPSPCPLSQSSPSYSCGINRRTEPFSASLCDLVSSFDILNHNDPIRLGLSTQPPLKPPSTFVPCF